MEVKLEDLDMDDVELGEHEGELDTSNVGDTDDPWADIYEQPSGEEDNEGDEGEQSQQDDLVSTILKSKGINPSSIKFQNNEGEIEEKDFNDLTKEEQLQILTFDDSEDNFGLVGDEVELINELRDNNLSVEEYKEFIKRQAIQEYLETNGEEPLPTYEVDSIPDDELFIADLKVKIPELSDEELSAELEIAKQNETLYQKKIQGIRNEYKKKEDLILQQEEEERLGKQQESALKFESAILSVLENDMTIDLGGPKLELSDEELNQIASFILDEDVTGVRHIAKALNDPKTLVDMVWYVLNGKEAIGQLSNFYKQKITEASKVNYNKGYEDAKNGTKSNPTKSIVKKPTKNGNKITSIHDLD